MKEHERTFGARVVRRGFRLERWRVSTWLRYYRGYGQPLFEFEFRFGRPAPFDWTYTDLEPDVEACELCDGTGCPCTRARDWESMELGCDCGCAACGLKPADPSGSALSGPPEEDAK